MATTAADCEVMSLMHGPRPGTVVDRSEQPSVFHPCRGSCRFVSGVSEIPSGMLQEVLETVGPALSGFLCCR
jgi:hypothetical protein